MNMSDTAVTFDGVRGAVTLSTDRTLEGAAVEGALTLEPWSGLVVSA